MKKLIILLLFIPLVSFGQDFRKMSFGDTKEQLKETYPDVDFDVENDQGYEMLYHVGMIAGIKTQIGYVFLDNKFTIGSYVFAENDFLRSGAERVRDYNNVSGRLNDKYDMVDMTEWYKTSYKDDNPGFALELNHVSFREDYEGEKLVIIHTLKTESSSTEHSVIYATREFAEMMWKQVDEDF